MGIAFLKGVGKLIAYENARDRSLMGFIFRQFNYISAEIESRFSGR